MTRLRDTTMAHAGIRWIGADGPARYIDRIFVNDAATKALWLKWLAQNGHTTVEVHVASIEDRRRFRRGSCI